MEEAKRLEIEGVNAANVSDLGKAIEYLNRAIEIAPNRASGYNNRAQALRLKGDINGKWLMNLAFVSLSNNKMMFAIWIGALDDLNKAIVLSFGKGKAGSQALCQRGLIYKLVGKNSEALNDFECAAKLGNQFAKSMIVQTNPYAALCNQMLRDIMSNIHRGNERQEDQTEHWSKEQ